MCEALGGTVCVTECTTPHSWWPVSACAKCKLARGARPPPGPGWGGRQRSSRRGGACSGAEPAAGWAQAAESRRSWRGSWSPGAAARPGCMEVPSSPAPPGASVQRTA